MIMRNKCAKNCACGQPCDLPDHHVKDRCECISTRSDPEHLAKTLASQNTEKQQHSIPLMLHRESGSFKFSAYGITTSSIAYSASDAMDSFMKECYRVRNALHHVPVSDLSESGARRLDDLNHLLGPPK